MDILSFYVNKKIVRVKIEWTTNKNIYLKIKNDDIVVSAPKGVNLKLIEKFVSENIGKFSKYLDKEKKNKLFSIQENFIYLKGKKRQFIVLTGFKKLSFKEIENNLYLNTKTGDEEEVIFIIKSLLKKTLEDYLKKNINIYEKKLFLDSHDIKIRYKTSAWGTNIISKRRISFSSRLAHYDNDVIDYVIVHELAHTLEPNHSSNFWKIVESIIPDYKKIRNQLKSIPNDR
ncbi:MAG: M48 family metallopeptidase [Mycoplasmatales bacterium]|nr:M48 family metallopeptidase [Mycoplasmatales bacterium]